MDAFKLGKRVEFVLRNKATISNSSPKQRKTVCKCKKCV